MTSPKYPGRTIFLHEEPDGQWSMYNFYHAKLATGSLESLVPLIYAHHPVHSLPVHSPLSTAINFNLDLLKE